MTAHILVAEDELGVRAFVGRALTGAGYRVELTEDGSEALAALRRGQASGETCDLLLTDILMPVMDGVSLALSAARDMPAMPIILMTGYSDQKERASGLESIISDILLKPFTLSELLDRVSAVLAVRNA